MKNLSTTEPTPNEPKSTTEVHAPKKKFWNSDKILSLSAIFMSACTLLVLIYQTNIMREQQAMSVYPYLELGDYGGGTPNYQFMLSNNGVGPALIKAVRIHYQGEIFEEDLATHLRKIITPKDSIDFYHSNISQGRLIPPNTTLPLIQLANGNYINSKKLSEFIHDEQMDFEIEYGSIYGERWIFSNNKPVPRKLD